MCNFVSWIEYKDKNYFLENAHLETREGEKLLADKYRADIEGHGAIEHYYPELRGKGVRRECEDFSTPDNFPPEIAAALVSGRLTRIGMTLDIFTPSALAEYQEIRRAARAEYVKIHRAARAEYVKIHRAEWDKYVKIRGAAWAKLARDPKNLIRAWRTVKP